MKKHLKTEAEYLATRFRLARQSKIFILSCHSIPLSSIPSRRQSKSKRGLKSNLGHKVLDMNHNWINKPKAKE